MFRKNIILTNQKKLTDARLPFHSWQCITLQLPSREVDLVIPDDKDMMDFIELLVDAMDAVNGQKGSAKIIKEKMHEQKFKRELKRLTKLKQTKELKKIDYIFKDKIWVQTQLTPFEIHQIKRTTLLKYKIMRIRAKISFIALKNNKTIFELFLDQIMNSYVMLARLKEEELGDLADQFELFRMNDHAFQQLISDGMGNIFHKIMQLNIRDV